jgi:hypothetical protein
MPFPAVSKVGTEACGDSLRAVDLRTLEPARLIVLAFVSRLRLVEV